MPYLRRNTVQTDAESGLSNLTTGRVHCQFGVERWSHRLEVAYKALCRPYGITQVGTRLSVQKTQEGIFRASRILSDETRDSYMQIAQTSGFAKRLSVLMSESVAVQLRFM